MNAPGYEQLAEVLQAAFNQAAEGKGAERHANGQPFHEQRMQTISTLLDSDAGMAFQVCKKVTEGMALPHAARERELLGAIVYIAGMVIFHRQREDARFDHALKVLGQAADRLAECRDAAVQFTAEQDVVSLIAEGVADAGSTGIPADLEPAVLANVEAFNAGSVELWTEDDERRMDVVAQNGNDGAAYAGKGPCLGCGGPHPLHRCGRDRPTGEDESQ